MRGYAHAPIEIVVISVDFDGDTSVREWVEYVVEFKVRAHTPIRANSRINFGTGTQVDLRTIFPVLRSSFCSLLSFLCFFSVNTLMLPR